MLLCFCTNTWQYANWIYSIICMFQCTFIHIKCSNKALCAVCIFTMCRIGIVERPGDFVYFTGPNCHVQDNNHSNSCWLNVTPRLTPYQTWIILIFICDIETFVGYCRHDDVVRPQFSHSGSTWPVMCRGVGQASHITPSLSTQQWWVPGGTRKLNSNDWL